jgi:hypothetical protein
MSITKRLIERQEQEDSIRNALQALIDDDRLSHPSSVGIAKKIIDEGNLDSLSAKQLDVFNTFIAPELKLRCEMCEVEIPLINYPEVIANEFFEGQMLCDGCLHLKEQMRKDED